MTNIILNGTAAVPIQQGNAAGFSLQNNGPGNVYLDNNASVSPATGYVVQPGVSLPLNANTVLYACTDNNKTATVQLLQGATATQATVVQANVPGAIQATVTNSLLQVAGNVNITNATLPISGNVNAAVSGNVGITGGSISVTGSSVSVSGGSVGTAAANHPTLIDTKTFTLGTGALAGVNQFNTWYQTAGYSSFIMVVTGGSTGGPVLNVANYLSGFVQQAINVPDSVHIISQQSPQWLLDDAVTGSIKVPVQGDWINLVLNATKAAGAVTYPFTVYIYGSSEVVNRPYYQSYSSQLQGGVATGQVFSKTQAAAGSVSSFVSTVNGPVALNIYGAGSVANVAMYACQNGATNGIAALYTQSGTNGSVVNMNLPLLPILLVQSLTSGSAVTSLSQ